MKNSLLILLVSFNVAAFACSDIFINKAGYHVEILSVIKVEIVWWLSLLMEKLKYIKMQEMY